MITKEQIKKFNIPCPRYTSFPVATEWKSFTESHFYHKKLESLDTKRETLSLYLHVPFCHSLCYYCGCNVSIRKDRAEYGDEFLRYIEIELKLISNSLQSKPTVSQFHIGGGTPTFLSIQQLKKLMDLIQRFFTLDMTGEISIEIEPRTIDIKKLKWIREFGFNRISMGVQDFDPKVQKAINRQHSFEQISELVEICRDLKFKSINLDFIYGLPFQTIDSIKKTIDLVLDLKPDRLAFYSFAHVPWVKPHQKKIDSHSLPTADEKINIFLQAREKLIKGGYCSIGMDHFALESDEMSKAFLQGKLHRNFMGYTLMPNQHLIGIGPSAIGYVNGSYVQNQKRIPEYYKSLNQNTLPVTSGIHLSKDDVVRKEVITSLMCKFRVNKHTFQDQYELNFDDYFSTEKKHLKQCETDGLLQQNEREIAITSLGKIFIRNVVMGFDPYLRKEQKENKFSQAV